MKLNELSPSVPKKERKKSRKRKLFWLGKTAGKGSNGQNSRAGRRVKPYLKVVKCQYIEKSSKRGFSNAVFKKEYKIISLDLLNNFEMEKL